MKNKTNIFKLKKIPKLLSIIRTDKNLYIQ